MRIHHRFPTRGVLFAAAVGVIVASPAGGQRVRGNVLAEFTDQPIAAASVYLLMPDGTRVAQGATTSNDGTFTLSAPSAGVYRLYTARSGYRRLFTPAIQLNQNEEIGVTLRML